MLDTRDRAAGINARPPQSSGMSAFRDSHAAAPSGQEDANSAASLENFLRDTLFDPRDPAALGDMLRSLVEHGYDRAPFVPLPGHGATLARWRALAAVAACDLGLVKLFEGHTDALAILAELQGSTPPAGSRWGVWAAEPPDARVQAVKVGIRSDGEGLRLSGTKAWCSGAGVVTHALVTAWLNDEPILAAVAMDQPSISIDASKWQAVGMQATASADVSFDQASATLVGGVHSYVRRPGFWHGGAGIAACWYGAAAQIGRMLREASTQRADAHRLAHLGAVDVALAGAAAVLRETAAHIDANPLAESQREAMRARLVIEEAATAVMNHATRTLGAGPLCRNARFARALADLPVFLRQSHAERDLAALGELVAAAAPADARDGPAAGGAPWML
ncbi:acyl-CoA dehydrogenase [Paraburkholderia sp. FT54]|uniref:acyl-CoA dehydrogenase n=1 Tax=Paraburkholderia sp. FT54 TaxID=3074437 RepID=UPI0028778C8F|nr:acyl-CoA dehydrogenase [Paraburkholderia sp. FT54]WNC91438.1 acyl-CoA dehydrogenase [Paraburkholderia sp. FT54]